MSINPVFLKDFSKFTKTNQSIPNLGLVAVVALGRQFEKLRMAVLCDQQYINEFLHVGLVRVGIRWMFRGARNTGRICIYFLKIR